MERTVEKLKRERENQGGEKKKKKKKKKRRRTENFGVSLAMQDGLQNHKSDHRLADNQIDNI
jgi:hypothetical protein